MPDQPAVPEPAELHAEFARDHPLNWGVPIPSRADLAATYSLEAVQESLTLLERVRSHHRQITADLLSSLPDKSETCELQHRVKSPQSLARKIDAAWQMDRDPLTDDVVRFTVLAASPSQLVEVARQTVERLRDHGWRVESAHHSYVKGTRYKGLHAGLRSAAGVPVEVQFHSPESIRVKAETTELYHTQRDLQRDQQDRDAAEREAIGLSATMTQPPGLRDLHLDGVPVVPKRYGSSRGSAAPARGSGGSAIQRQHQRPGRGRTIENDGRTR